MHAAALHIHPLRYEPRPYPPLNHCRQVPFGPLEGSHGQPGMGWDMRKVYIDRAYSHLVHTSDEKSSSGAASMALTVSLLLGCTVANPPDTENNDRIEEAGGGQD